MTERILFPTDGSDAALSGFEYAAAIAAHADAELFVLHVADTSEISHTRVAGTVVDAFVQEGEAIVEETVAAADTRNIEVTTDVIQGVPDKTIVDYVEGYDIDRIVMASGGRDGMEHVVGSTTERVLRRATVPVLAVPPGVDAAACHPHEAVLVAVDGSDAAEAAVDAGAAFAERYGASLHLVHVLEVSSLGGAPAEGAADSVLDAATRRVPDSFSGSVAASAVRASSVHDGLLEYAEANDIDLLVAGTRGRSGLGRFLLGSTTERMVRSAPVPVLTVRERS